MSQVISNELDNSIEIPVETRTGEIQAHTEQSGEQFEHEISLSAEPIYTIGSFNITNSL